MTDESASLHVLKHVTDPAEHWGDLLGIDGATVHAVDTRELVVRSQFYPLISQSWTAASALSTTPGEVLRSFFFRPELAGLADQQGDWAQLTMELSCATKADLSANRGPLASPLGRALRQVAGKRAIDDGKWLFLIAWTRAQTARVSAQAAESPALASVALQLTTDLRAELTRVGALPVGRRGALVQRLLDPDVLDAAGQLAQARVHLKEKASDILDRYRARAHSSCVEAGSTPRHCVFDRKEWRGDEAYVDRDGVTVVLSRKPRWTLRTAYRQRQGRTRAEKGVEAAHALQFLDQAQEAIADFERFLGGNAQQGTIRSRFTEETWPQLR